MPDAELLRGNIAWSLQARCAGKDPAGLRTILLKALNRHERPKREICKPDTRLIREWQGEACEAYIKSQRDEGWHLIPPANDDGGISGGTMDRPALTSLSARPCRSLLRLKLTHLGCRRHCDGRHH